MSAAYLRHGPELAAPEAREIQADLASAKHSHRLGRPAPLTEARVKSEVAQASDSQHDGRVLRDSGYSALGLRTRYT